MNDRFDEDEDIVDDLGEQPAAAVEIATVDALSPDSEPGEILQLLSYRENVVDQPKLLISNVLSFEDFS